MAFLVYFVPKFLSRPIIKPVRSRGLAFFRKKPKEYPFLIHRPALKDYCEILRLMWESYFPEEPTTVALALGHSHNPIFDEQVIQSLSEGLSLVARCKYTGDIVGGSVNRTTCPWDADNMERFACTLACPKMRSLMKFYAHIEREPKLFETFCTNKIFEISQTFVIREERRKGLGRKLIEASRGLGADCGFRVIRVDATSEFTAKICEDMGMQRVYTIRYDDYVGVDNQPIFRVGPPHEACKIYIDVPHSREAYQKAQENKRKKPPKKPPPKK